MTKSIWTDYAVLAPSTPTFHEKTGKPVQWKVQRNQHGQFRCSCPSFIFQRLPPEQKSCKHTRHCAALEGATTAPKPTVSAAALATAKPLAVTLPVKPVVAPHWETASEMVTAMVSTAKATLTPLQIMTMTDVLAAKLQMFKPAPMPIKPAVAATHGVRMIVFDD